MPLGNLSAGGRALVSACAACALTSFSSCAPKPPSVATLKCAPDSPLVLQGNDFVIGDTYGYDSDYRDDGLLVERCTTDDPRVYRPPGVAKRPRLVRSIEVETSRLPMLSEISPEDAKVSSLDGKDYSRLDGLSLTAEGWVVDPSRCARDAPSSILWEGVRRSTVTSESLAYVRYEGARKGCVAASRRVATVIAPAIVPGLLYAFRETATELVFVTPRTTWQVSSAGSPRPITTPVDVTRHSIGRLSLVEGEPSSISLTFTPRSIDLFFGAPADMLLEIEDAPYSITFDIDATWMPAEDPVVRVSLATAASPKVVFKARTGFSPRDIEDRAAGP